MRDEGGISMSSWIIAARTDIRPRCDVHRGQQMVAVQMIPSNQGDRWPAYACTEPGCVRFYSVWEGYFALTKGAVAFDRTKQMICPEDQTALYLDNYEPQGRIATWRCAQFNCKHGETVRGDQRRSRGDERNCKRFDGTSGTVHQD